MNLRTWIRSAIWTVVAVAAFAQAPATFSGIPESAAPEVGKALRDRVTQFFGYHIGSLNRRALDMVASDTQDYYYATQKILFEDFRIDRLEFNEKLDKATVWGHAHRNMSIQGQTFKVDSDVITTWKLEDGKWVWYLDQNSLLSTPMSNPNAQAGAAAASSPSVAPDSKIVDITKPENLLAQSQSIMQQSGMDKNEIVLTWGKAGSGVYTFQNGFPGDVMLELAGGDFGVPGLKIRLEKGLLKAHENGRVLVEYNPPATTEPLPYQDTQTYKMNLWLQPFNQIFPLKLTFKPGPRN